MNPGCFPGLRSNHYPILPPSTLSSRCFVLCCSDFRFLESKSMHVSFLLKVFKVPPWLSVSHLHGMTGEALRDLASADPLLVISSHGPLGKPLGLCMGSSPSWQSLPPNTHLGNRCWSFKVQPKEHFPPPLSPLRPLSPRSQ